MMKRVISAIIAIVIALTACSPIVYAKSSKLDTVTASDFEGMTGVQDYKERVREKGYHALSTKEFLVYYNTFALIGRILTGDILIPRKKLDIEITDQTMLEFCDYMLEATDGGFDYIAILENLPQVDIVSGAIVKLFDIDTEALRNYTIEKSDECASNGQGPVGVAWRFFGMYLSCISKVEFYGVDRGNGEYEIMIHIIYKDGSEDFQDSDIMYTTYTDPETGEQKLRLYGESVEGIAYSGFEVEVTHGTDEEGKTWSKLVTMTTLYSWQRNFGYGIIYDIMANTCGLFNFRTRRLPFEYNGMEYQIQLWKGIYLIANGAEIGVYKREAGSRGTFYDCVENDDFMEMSMSLYHGEELLFERYSPSHWWLTGFRVKGEIYHPKTMTLYFSITMKDEDMLQAFTKSIDEHYLHDISYTVDGLTVSGRW